MVIYEEIFNLDKLGFILDKRRALLFNLIELYYFNIEKFLI